MWNPRRAIRLCWWQTKRQLHYPGSVRPHVGGANELAVSLAAGIGGTPVITTATDIHHLWAVDKFAQENHLWIADMAKAKRISARLLAGEEIIVDCTCEENR